MSKFLGSLKFSAASTPNDSPNDSKEDITPGSDVDDGTVYNTASDAKRQIGVTSAVFLIFNRMIGEPHHPQPLKHLLTA